MLLISRLKNQEESCILHQLENRTFTVYKMDHASFARQLDSWEFQSEVPKVHIEILQSEYFAGRGNMT